jgi:hypothetical protein
MQEKTFGNKVASSLFGYENDDNLFDVQLDCFHLSLSRVSNTLKNCSYTTTAAEDPKRVMMNKASSWKKPPSRRKIKKNAKKPARIWKLEALTKCVSMFVSKWIDKGGAPLWSCLYCRGCWHTYTPYSYDVLAKRGLRLLFIPGPVYY